MVGGGRECATAKLAGSLATTWKNFKAVSSSMHVHMRACLLHIVKRSIKRYEICVHGLALFLNTNNSLSWKQAPLYYSIRS